MKRILVALLGLSLLFTFSCKRYGHVKMRLMANTGEKSITIAVSENGGVYTLEASIPNNAYLKKGMQRAHWVVINNTHSATVNSVVIDTFHDTAGNKDPFEGTGDDQKFTFGTIGAGDEASITSNKAKRFPGTTDRNFKYKVTVVVAGTTLTVDPVVVVGD